MRVRLAWALFGLTCVFAAIQVALIAISDRGVTSVLNVNDGFPLATIGAVGGAGVGALIVSKYPRHRIGWLFVVGQCGTAFGMAAQAYARAAISGEISSAPAGHLAVWLAIQTSAIFAITLLSVLFLLAPDGHLLSPRWRWMVGVSLLGLLLNWVAIGMVRPSRLDADGAIAPGDSALLSEILITAGVLLGAVGLIGATVSLVKRRRRATGEQREQLRWMVLAAAGIAVAVLIAVVAGLAGAPPWIAVGPLMAAYAAVPFLTGIAILRFRLYDIDVFVSRAIVLTVLTGLVAVGYVVVVVVISEIVGAPAEGTFWPSLLATALVAISIQPLRRRVSQLADRVVYGAQAAPYEALAEFSKGLHESPTTAELLPKVAEAVGLAVGARQAQIWIDVPGKERMRMYWPDRTDQGPDLVLPVGDADELLGGLSVTMPPGRPLRPAEDRLLHDFAVQLGRAFRNIRLESELADRVDELADQAAELSASSRRLLSAQAAGRHRFESAISREVLPHLTRLVDELAVVNQDHTPDPDAVDRMVAGTNEALDALRTLTRGVFPAQLAHRGLVPALSSQLVLTGLTGILRVDESAAVRRFHPRVESAAYFCGVEFLRELDPPEEVTLSARDETLVLAVAGRGTAAVETRTRHLADRVAPLGGTVRIRTVGPRATLHVEIPLASHPGLVPDPQQAAGAER